MANSRPILELLAKVLDDPADLSPVTDPESWRRLRAESPRFGVAAAVAHRAAPLLQGEDREWCEKLLQMAWMRHQVHLHRNLQVLETLDRAGIPSVALKGVIQAERYFEPPHTRRNPNDIDVLIPLDARAHAARTLAPFGFKPNAAHQWVERALFHHLSVHREGWPRVELHFHLTRRYRMRTLRGAEYLENAIPADVGGKRVCVLSPGDEIFFAVVHWATHRFPDFSILLDLRKMKAKHGDEAMRAAAERSRREHWVSGMRIGCAAYESRWKQRFLAEGDELPRTLFGCGPGLHERFARASQFQLPYTFREKLELIRLNAYLADDLFDLLYTIYYPFEGLASRFVDTYFGGYSHKPPAAKSTP